MTDRQPVSSPWDETRYASQRTDSDEYIIYDPQNPHAWIQSDTVHPIRDSDATSSHR